MKYEAAVKRILYEFRIGKNYAGYEYIIDGIHLMEEDENSIGHITKTLYVDIANKHNTTSVCVERNIRTIVEVIWKNKDIHEELLVKIFGQEYMIYRPSNTRFFEMLYSYMLNGDFEESCKKCPNQGCMYCLLKNPEQLKYY